MEARLAQSVERKALNLVVVGSSPTVGASFSLVATLFACGPPNRFCLHHVTNVTSLTAPNFPDLSFTAHPAIPTHPSSSCDESPTSIDRVECFNGVDSVHVEANGLNRDAVPTLVYR